MPAKYTQEYLDSLSDEEFDRAYQQEFGQQPSLARAATPAPPMEQEDQGYWSRALSNAPSDLPNSIMEVLRGTGTAAKNILLPSRESGQMLRTLGRTVKGAVGVGANDPLNPNTPRAELMQALGQGMEYLPGGEQFPEHPTRAAVEMAGLIGPGKGSGLFGRMARSARYLDPVNAATGAANLVRKGIGASVPTMARSVASVTTGVDPSVLSTASDVMGSTARDIASQTGVDLAKAGEFGALQRQEFRAARGGRGSQDIAQAIDQVSEGIRAKMDNIAQTGIAQFRGVAVDPKSYQGFMKGLSKKLRERDIHMTPTGLDFSASVIPRDTAAHGRIKEALEYTLDPLKKSDPTIGDVWLARRRIDEAASSALKQQYGDFEVSTLKQIRRELSDYLNGIPNEDFQRFNGEYAAAATMREHFDMLVAGKTNPDTQVASLLRSIKSGRELSADFIRTVEVETGVPLRALAAGKELSDWLPRGLIGRSMMASAPFAAMLGKPEFVVGLLLTPPNLVGRYIGGIGAAQRLVKASTQWADEMVTLSGLPAQTVQTMTLGRLLNHLNDAPQAQPESLQQPNSIRGLGRFSAMPEPER